MKSTVGCSGCHHDFYNGKNQLGIAECWHLKGATMRTRFRIGTSTPQDQASNFRRERTYHCNQPESGSVLYDQLPEHLRP